MPDLINHPPHYNSHPSGVECIDIVEQCCFNLGNAIKYLFRREAKGNETENLSKAKWYVQREVQRRMYSEFWRPYPLDARYEVSTLGRVRMIGSTDCRALVPLKNGYLTFMTRLGGKNVLHYVHRAVLLSHKSECPDGMEAAHANGNRAECALWNLDWKTRKDNLADRVKHGTVNWGESNGKVKLSLEDVEKIRVSWHSTADLASEFGISTSQVSRIKKGLNWNKPEDGFVALVDKVFVAEPNAQIARAIKWLALAQWSPTWSRDLSRAIVNINYEIERVEKETRRYA